MVIEELSEIEVVGGGGRSNGPLDSPIGWTQVRKTLVADSEIWPGYALPVTFLAITFAQMDASLVDFVVDAFLVKICDSCMHTQIPVAEIAPRLLRVYVETQADGNEANARLQPLWPTAERFVNLVASVAAGHSYLI